MARVIKAGGGQKAARAPTRVVIGGGQKKLIGRELFQAKQDAEHILMRAEQQRHAMLVEGKKRAAQAHEEAMTQGASEAFAAAAAEALAAFRRRAERYAEAAEDIRALALEVVKKIIGTDPDLGPKDVDAILSRGLAQLRARRRLRLQVGEARLAALAHERPNLMKALVSEPDLLIEAADDVGVGFARVVTEIGGALCAELTALDELARSVNVKETPRTGLTPNTAARTQSANATERRPRAGSVGELPEARVEEVQDDDDVERTINLGALKKKAPRYDSPSTDGPSTGGRADAIDDEIDEIEAEEDESRTEARPAIRPQPARVAAPPRAATRVVPIAASSSAASADGDDMELYTDEAVSPKKRR